MTGVANFFLDKIVMAAEGALHRPFDAYYILTGEIDNFPKLIEAKRRNATTSAISPHNIIIDHMPVRSS
jgi:hypothetical protein